MEKTELTITRNVVVKGEPKSPGDKLPGDHRDGNYLVAIGKATRSVLIEAKEEAKKSTLKKKKQRG